MSYPIVVLISGNGSNLQAIIDAIADKHCSAHIAAVISNRDDAYGLIRAQQAGIPTFVVNKQAGETRIIYDQRLEQAIAPFQPKLIVLAGFMRILSAEFVAHFKHQILNIHPSLLPKYPGLNTHSQVLANGDLEHGITIHIVTAELDAGPILCQSKLRVSPHETESGLIERIHALEHQAYPMVIDWFATKRITLEDEIFHLDQQPLSPQGILSEY